MHGNQSMMVISLDSVISFDYLLVIHTSPTNVFTITNSTITKIMINVGKIANGRCDSVCKVFMLMLVLNLNLIGNYFMHLMIF